MTTSISSLFQAGLFRNYNFEVSELNILTSKTTSLGISQMWSPFFNFKIYGDINCPGSRYLKINKTVQMFNISVNF